jgi:hypothetical protein
MKPFLILTLCLFGAVLMQGCKKDSTDTETTTTTETPILQAYIGGTVWTPDTLSASINYNAATSSKTFNCTGTIAQKRIVFSVKQANALNDNTFPAGTYNVDGTGTVNMAYYTQQLAAAGVYNFVLHGTVQPGSGTVTVSSIDAANKTITGTYSFTSTKVNYDLDGNYESISVASITSGVFNAMPYTFNSN